MMPPRKAKANNSLPTPRGVILSRHQHQAETQEDRGQPRQRVDRSVFVSRLFGHFIEIQRQCGRQGDKHETRQRGDASANHDEEVAPLLWLIDIRRHRDYAPPSPRGVAGWALIEMSMNVGPAPFVSGASGLVARSRALGRAADLIPAALCQSASLTA